MYLLQTGGDGCICYLEYDRDRKNLEFIGMKQVKELSLIQYVSEDNDSIDDFASGHYAAGFASADFVIWNLITEAKVLSLSPTTKVIQMLPCLFYLMPKSAYWCRLCKYHVVDGGVLILIILVLYQRCRTALHMSRFVHPNTSLVNFIINKP